MNHRPGLDRSQMLIFPERLEDYIAAENPVRFLDAFVASLDPHMLGFDKPVVLSGSAGVPWRMDWFIMVLRAGETPALPDDWPLAVASAR